MTRLERTRAAGKGVRAKLEPYKRHLSAAAMLAGFATDNILLGRVDIPATQAILAVYILVAGLAILLLHFAEARGADGRIYRWRNFLPLVIQFALGSSWSGLLVFYSRSAVIAASWPFLLLLVAIFFGNEIFNRYIARLVFSATLLFFALFSYAIFLVPIYMHAIGTRIFLLSGAFASLAFLAFLRVLSRVGPEGFRRARLRIFGGSAGLFALINIFYFVNILPPLPLALSAIGVYHSVEKVGDTYIATGEPEPWYTGFGWQHTVGIPPGAPVSVFSSVFAPVRLTTQISHRWEWYSPVARKWLDRGRVTFTVTGGRDGGYRGYSVKRNPAPGDWRVDIETSDGRLIGRIRFTLINTSAQQNLQRFALTR